MTRRASGQQFCSRSKIMVRGRDNSYKRIHRTVKRLNLLTGNSNDTASLETSWLQAEELSGPPGPRSALPRGGGVLDRVCGVAPGEPIHTSTKLNFKKRTHSSNSRLEAILETIVCKFLHYSDNLVRTGTDKMVRCHCQHSTKSFDQGPIPPSLVPFV